MHADNIVAWVVFSSGIAALLGSALFVLLRKDAGKIALIVGMCGFWVMVLGAILLTIGYTLSVMGAIALIIAWKSYEKVWGRARKRKKPGLS